MKDQTYSTKDKIIQIIAEEQEEHHAHKPFMTKVPIKQTPIGYEFHQIHIPDFDPQNALKPTQQRKIKWGSLEIDASVPVFLRSKINEQELLKYLSFVQNYLQQKVPDYFLQTSRERTRSMALELLHESNYNYTKAKFYILFPYYKTYNLFKRHEPLVLSEEQMEHKINAHIESLKSSKQNDLMKWVKTIQNQMESRIHISKINTYMQIARHNKFDIPDNIKDIIERSSKIGKDIKKNVLNSKNTLQKLQMIKAQLQDQKIVTNQMIHFEQAVSRAQQWIKKQNKFQEQYFNAQYKQNGQVLYELKQPQFFKQFGKIQYRSIQSLVNQYNSLPLLYPAFVQTTLVLYEQTNKLIAKIPSLSKAAKTRKSQQGTGIIKLPRKFITQILSKVSQIPVQHQDFVNFEFSILDGLQQIQRISMFLEDTKFQKNLKNLNQYQKLISDVPIQNDVQKKLNQKIQYYELIDKIKKDISNPAKYDSLKDQLLRLKQKGYQSIQHAKLQARVMTCMGWHQSQLLIRQQKKINSRTFIILNQKTIKSKMIRYQIFEAQLYSARNQLNIPEEILKQSQARLQLVSQLKRQISQILNQQQPLLIDMLMLFKVCYENGIAFFQFESLYQKLTTILIIVAKMHYLLNTSDQISNSKSNEFYFTNSECQKVIDFICDKKNQIKDLRTKQTGDEIISTVRGMNFPRGLYQWRVFQQFMRKAQQWSDRAMKIIQDFKNNDNMSNTREVIQQSRHCLHSKLIQQQLNRIQLALKWRQKIARKMMDENALNFQDYEHEFMSKLQTDLQLQETNFCTQEQMMFKSLQYMHEHGQVINGILQKIADYPIQKVIILKLSQMNKFVKEIDKQIEKYQIKDKIIDKLKQQLQIQLLLNQDWKERYLAIKRFQKKKIGHNPTLRQTSSRRREDQDPDNQISFDLMKEQKQQQNHDYFSGYIPKAMQVPYSPCLLMRPNDLFESQKKKYVIKNGEFCWYFRMLLMVFQFYNGCKLKFVVQEFIKLKNTLTDIYRLIQKYNAVYQKSQKTDFDFQFLQAEACKIPIFFKQSYLITNKYSQIVAWKNIADHVLRSVPVINMELKARRVQDWRQILQKKKNQQILNQNKATQDQVNQTSNKRRRKPNQLYENQDITLFRDDIVISKNKKRKSASSMRGINQHQMSQNGHSSTYDAQYRSSSHHTNKKHKQDKQHHHIYKDQRESLQKIQQLLNGDGNLQFIIDDPNQYCICRNGVPNQNSLMVACQYCNGWYHIECIGIKKHQAKSEDNYLCVGCKSLMDQYQGNYGYFWDHYQKITEYALIEIYEQGKNLQVQTTELQKITMVYNAMIKWKEDTNNLLKKLIEENPTDLSIYQEQIYPLYLQSMWLPTVHYEAIHLKKLMKHIRRS